MIKYREDKATQAAAILIELSGGKINHMKLIKLLYFAERRALLNWGKPITYDTYVSMPHGPVLSFTLDRINYTYPPGKDSSYWHTYISERQNHEVILMKSAPNDQLSRAEEKLLKDVWKELGHMNEWEIEDHSHLLPEWKDPEGSSIRIEIKDIFLAEGFSEEDIQEVIDAIEAEAYTEKLLG